MRIAHNQKRYVSTYLLAEMEAIRSSKRMDEFSVLNIYDKALIYKYSTDGYEKVNQTLRKSKGKKLLKFGFFLTQALNKLPDFEGVVYRSAILEPDALRVYQEALDRQIPLTEPTFVSSSKSKLIVEAFRGNTFFMIFSKTGKDIEKIARFGCHGIPPSENEEEVLFVPNLKFEVLEVTKQATYTLIVMEEI